MRDNFVLNLEVKELEKPPFTEMNANIIVYPDSIFIDNKDDFKKTYELEKSYSKWTEVSDKIEKFNEEFSE